MANSLAKKKVDSYDFNTMAYLLKNTVSEYGFVSRGECEVNDAGYLTDVTERTHIEIIEGEFMRKDDDGKFIPIVHWHGKYCVWHIMVFFVSHECYFPCMNMKNHFTRIPVK